MTNRKAYITRIENELGSRKLIWVGTRGHDAASLMELPQFAEAYGIIAPLGAVSLDVDLALEEISGQRVDLDTYKFDDDRSEPAHEFRRRLLDSLTEPAVVVAYRPLALLSTLCYPRAEFVTYLGMFHERQATFEHKPWVENELRRCGIPTIPWRYFAEEDRQRLEDEVAATGIVVVRSNRSDGGAGLRTISTPDEVGIQMSSSRDGFIAASPLLEPHIPLNVNACVFRNGAISLHPASVQLIGLEGCTNRRFGYCGNDFAAIKSLDAETLEKVEALVLSSGVWLCSQGYIGAFGVDAIIHEGAVMLAEVNPRFQGSSLLSASIDKRMSCADVYLCHLAAHLELHAPPVRRLSEIVHGQPHVTQVIVHNCSSSAVKALSGSNDNYTLEIVPSEEVDILPNAIEYRAVIPCSITANGHQIDEDILSSLCGPVGSRVGNRNTIHQLSL